ncbi:RNA polymerase sigma factor [Marinivivus vitaminiproducens]|uniref:RNA polymerase sigma factor n=1 Tax=Marinivivus vitaminiproducens TaxID=3035935 RepID=UPI00279AA07D|nr:RNA polymerase sigma factor [Geminicoccaceae bacterium SCSIO 64248]
MSFAPGRGSDRTMEERTDAASPADEALMAKVGRGDADAFAVLSARHLARTLALAQRMLGTRGDAEDVAQDVFLRVWTHAPRWRQDGARFTTWLYRVTVNLCLDRKRRPVPAHLDEAPEPADHRVDTEADMERRQTADLVADALAHLPERQRAALALCYDAGLGNVEAAAVLDISIGALESLLVRGRRALRERLSDLAKAL